tara:strand:- start:1479 stop:1814 length:336 start_codon:yes stop_codon:yes gene_type:complete
MKTISATNLRVQLRDLLADLDTGPVSITKHGKVVAVLSAPDEPVEAIEATPPTEYIPKALAPPQRELEDEDPLDDFDRRVEDLDADFEAYLSKSMPMDRPDYYPEDKVFLR